MALTIDFRFTGAGWTDIEIANGDRTYLLQGLSYLTPVLDDVVRAAIQIATGAWRAHADFEMEPGIRRLGVEQAHWSGHWVFQPRILVLDYHGSESDPRATDFTQICAMDIDKVEEFSTAILHAARSIRDRHGYEGYDDLWTSTPFPVRAVAALEAALATEPLVSKHAS